MTTEGKIIRTVEEAKADEELQLYFDKVYGGDLYDSKLDCAAAKEYVYNCLSHGCFIKDDYCSSYNVGGKKIHGKILCFETEDDNSDYVMFMTSIYGNILEHIFMNVYDGSHLIEYNVCKQCREIDIYDREKLIKAAYRCHGCGKAFESQDEFRFVPFAGLYCSDCYEPANANFNEHWYD